MPNSNSKNPPSWEFLETCVIRKIIYGKVNELWKLFYNFDSTFGKHLVKLCFRERKNYFKAL